MARSFSSSDLEDMDDDIDDYQRMTHERLSCSDISDESDDDLGEDAGLKEQMYQDKLAAFKGQHLQLKERTHPEYRKKLKKIDSVNKERLRMNELVHDTEREKVEKEYILEKKLALREFEEKKAELKENLLLELEEKKKTIEQERYTLDLNGDSMEYKAVSTRKLRRRGVEPAPTVEKRRKPMTTTLQLLLDEHEVEEDLSAISRTHNHATQLQAKQKGSASPGGQSMEGHSNEPRIENGKLYFDKKWFQKGQAVMVDCKDGSRFNAVLLCAESNMILVRKMCDNSRLKISLGQLAHGKYLVRRRNTATV